MHAAVSRAQLATVDWKGGSKVKKVSLYVNLEGVTVTKMQTKKKVHGSWYTRARLHFAAVVECAGPQGWRVGLVSH